MKIKITEQQYRILTEATIFDVKKYTDTKNLIEYRFNADGIKYFIRIFHYDYKHKNNVYEVEFGILNQETFGDRAGRDLYHLNSVLNTVLSVVEKEVKEKKIRYIKLEGAADEKDSGSAFNSTIRTKIYYRYLKNRYPDDALSLGGRFIMIDISKLYPELFTEESKIEKIVKVLERIGDEEEMDINNAVSGDDNDFNIELELISSNYGVVYFNITINVHYNHYAVETDIDGDQNTEEFETFDDLYNYLNNF